MLEYKKISDDTIRVMRDAVGEPDNFYDKAVEGINSVVSDGDVFVLNSANACLVAVAECVPGPVLVCDMGGWNGFIRSCELFGKHVEYLPTLDGIVDIELLNDYLTNHDVKSFYVTSLAGYSAPQPLEEIFELCALHDVLLINDVSGSVGDKNMTSIGDIIVSSTGSPKIVNIENGGFICNNNPQVEFNKHLLKSLKADNITCAGIAYEISKAPSILEKTMELNKYLKEKLEKNGINVIHPDMYALNTMIIAPSKSKAKRLAYLIRERLSLDGNIISVGPSYNRVKRPCVIIEVKNLNINVLEKQDMNYLCDIILEELGNI